MLLAFDFTGRGTTITSKWIFKDLVTSYLPRKTLNSCLNFGTGINFLMVWKQWNKMQDFCCVLWINLTGLLVALAFRRRLRQPRDSSVFGSKATDVPSRPPTGQIWFPSPSWSNNKKRGALDLFLRNCCIAIQTPILILCSFETQLKFIQGYLLLQFELAANIDYEAEAAKAEHSTQNVQQILANRIKKARKDFQV